MGWAGLGCGGPSAPGWGEGHGEGSRGSGCAAFLRLGMGFKIPGRNSSTLAEGKSEEKQIWGEIYTAQGRGK